jgi:hypothetical protein
MLSYNGLSESGNIKSTLAPPFVGTATYPNRVLFDSVFFVWVGIVLMNIITGLMVDTFSSLRGEKEDRESTLATDCFVCGTQRSTYEDLGLPPAFPSFQDHLASDHDLWSYVFYIAYLKSKVVAEQNVYQCIIIILQITRRTHTY